MRAAWVRIVEGYQEAGVMRADVPADHVARTMIAAVQGFAAQQALFGAAPVEVIQDGLRALMSVEQRADGARPAAAVMLIRPNPSVAVNVAEMPRN